jgi:hypothetical protein
MVGEFLAPCLKMKKNQKQNNFIDRLYRRQQPSPEDKLASIEQV